ncbi:NAD(P)-dependent oxidoreductase [Rhodobacter sp. 24-YEA-8]|uniref:NAD-dependent epimerase/dehydratase family protein n=1 Tax=Rhodobacter sp. 24-YEA-8 TaxID=1884310 RepID=UPI0014958D47|nr:NAD-dependent epimerase/dehydratase family protein [Rhodobacter sp. 24-YEA-8]
MARTIWRECGAKTLGETLSDTTVIVTGAAGRVGSILKRVWTAAPPPALQFLWSSRQAAPGIRWEIGAGPAPAWPRDAILLHLAGTTGARDPGANPGVIPPVLKACRQNHVRHLVCLSTAAVYAPGPVPARESDPPAPPGPYGAAKLEAERLLVASGLPLTILRLGNLAGADALLTPRPPGQDIRLDPVADMPGGPLRSWIGPLTFAQALAALLGRIAAGETLPPVLNIVQAPPLGMADLLRASDLAWGWAAPNPKVVHIATQDNAALAALLPLPSASPAQIIAEIQALRALPEP